MSSEATRRDFLKASLGVAAVAGLSSPAEAAPQAPEGKLLRGVVWGMLPEKSSIADRFKMAADAGFETVEAYTTPDQRMAEEIKKAADDGQNPDHLGDEPGALGIPALFERPDGDPEEHRRDADLDSQRQTLGSGRSAAGPGSRQPPDPLPGGVGPFAEAHPRN